MGIQFLMLYCVSDRLSVIPSSARLPPGVRFSGFIVSPHHSFSRRHAIQSRPSTIAWCSARFFFRVGLRHFLPSARSLFELRRIAAPSRDRTAKRADGKLFPALP